MLSHTDIKADAQRIADAMYKENSQKKVEMAQSSLMNRMFDLSGSLHVNFEPFHDYRGLVMEVAFLLIDPKISGKLQEDYYKENAPRILRNLFFFFDGLLTDDDLHKYLTWYNIKNFCGNATKEQLEYIEDIYKEKK